VPKKTVSGQGVGREIINAIKGAKRRIFIISPYISSDYAKLLLEKAKNGVNVKVITSKGRRTFSTAILSIYSGKISDRDLTMFEAHRRRRLRLMTTLITVYFFLLVLMLVSMNNLIPDISQPLFYGSLVAIAAIASTITYFIDLRYAVVLVLGALILALMLGVILKGPSIYAYVIAIFQILYPIGIVMSYIKWSSARTYKGIIEEFGAPKKLIEIRFASSGEKFIHSKIYIIDDVGFSGSVNLTFKSINKNVETITRYEGEDIEELERQFSEIWSMLDDPPIDVIRDIYAVF